MVSLGLLWSAVSAITDLYLYIYEITGENLQRCDSVVLGRFFVELFENCHILWAGLVSDSPQNRQFVIVLTFGRIIILATFFIYIRAGGEIYKRRRDLRKLDSTGGTGIDIETSKQPENYPVKTTEVSITSESMARTDPLWNPELNLSSESRLPGVYSITISSNHGASSRTPSNTDSSTDAVQTNPKRKKNYEASRAAWVYSKCALLFFTALLVTWIPSSANRVYGIVHDGQTIIALEILSATVLPLQGFWNAVIYIVTSWTAVKSSLSDLLHRMGHGNPSWDHTRRTDRDKRPPSFGTQRRNHGGDDTDSVIELAGNAIPISNIV